MQYIIETDNELSELMRLYMVVDNQDNNIEFYLERIRLAINNYATYPELINMIADLNIATTKDAELATRLMNNWNAVILQILYYILHTDMLLPIVEIHLAHRDLRLVTEG